MKSKLPFDQRDGFLWFNGKIIPWAEVKIHPLNHGLSYGSSIFEGERVYNGKIFKSLEHSKRFFNSAQLMNMEIGYTTEQLEDAKMQCINLNQISYGYMKVMAWRGSEDLTVFGNKTSTHLIISVWEVGENFNNDKVTNGIKIGISKWRKAPGDCFPYQAKIGGGYVVNTLIKHEMDKRALDDGLILDYQGNIAEASSSNFFAVKDNILYTPIPDCFLNGITRQTVIEIAKKNNIKVAECQISSDELKNFSEIFLTGTAAEIIPVTQIEDKKYSIGPITNFLIEQYKSLTNNLAQL